MTSEESKRNYFRISADFQIRFREISDEESVLFRDHTMRPAAHSGLQNQIENQLKIMTISEEAKALFEKAFSILISIDQRIERLEERLHDKSMYGISEDYIYVHGDLSAGGIRFLAEGAPVLPKVGALVLLDLLLPNVPEYRIVATAKVVHNDDDKSVGLEFHNIHDEDREFIHRFVISREREILRARALEREKNKN